MKKSSIITIIVLVALLLCALTITFLDGAAEFIIGVIVIEIATVAIMQMTGKMVTKGQKVIDEAKAAGRIIKANLVKHKFISGSMERGDADIVRKDHYNCVYEYTVGSETYKKKYSTYDYPSDTITLYYPKGKPDKAIATQEDMILSYASIGCFPIFMAVGVYLLFKLIIDLIIPFVQMIAERF